MTQRRRPSPAVYRRRRLAAALLAVALLALLVWGARALMDSLNEDDDAASSGAPAQPQDEDSDSDSAAAADDDPDETAAEEAGSDEDDAEAEDDDAEQSEGGCAPSDIEVRATTNQESYGIDVAPLLIMEIENTGDEECILEVGPSEQVFAVASPTREVFNTVQCGVEDDSLEVEFEPGQTEQAQLTWPRSDSSRDCTEPTELVTGDYELTVSVSGITSDPHSFHITGVEP